MAHLIATSGWLNNSDLGGSFQAAYSSNTTTGAKSSAIIYSIVQSAKDNNLKVEDYLTYVFKTMSETNQEALDLKTLLPHSKTLPKELYSHSKK